MHESVEPNSVCPGEGLSQASPWEGAHSDRQHLRVHTLLKCDAFRQSPKGDKVEGW